MKIYHGPHRYEAAPLGDAVILGWARSRYLPGFHFGKRKAHHDLGGASIVGIRNAARHRNAFIQGQWSFIAHRNATDYYYVGVGHRGAGMHAKSRWWAHAQVQSNSSPRQILGRLELASLRRRGCRLRAASGSSPGVEDKNGVIFSTACKPCSQMTTWVADLLYFTGFCFCHTPSPFWVNILKSVRYLPPPRGSIPPIMHKSMSIYISA